MAESPSLDKKLRYFAFKLALMEKAASTLGTMNFIWATVVLLGGFSQSLKSIDFWFVNVILVVEGLRILCRRGELATRRSWSPLTFIIHLYSLVIQELSAFACIALSSLRIQKQQYGSDSNLNRNRALNLFYWLSIVESILTLFGFVVRDSLMRPSDPERPSFNRFISDQKIPFISSFNSFVYNYYKKKIFSLAVGQNWRSALREDGFDDDQLDTVLPFFYETYSRCINGSVFDGLKIDFVSCSAELMQSIDYEGQLNGARLLSVLVKSDPPPSSEKLRVIGTTPGLLERLIEMLNWDKPIRTVAADIILKLVEIPQNRIRVMAIPESRESITSLLCSGIPESRERESITSLLCSGIFPESRESITSLLRSGSGDLGLRILKFFDDGDDNRAKMGTNIVGLRKIIELSGDAGQSCSQTGCPRQHPRDQWPH